MTDQRIESQHLDKDRGLAGGLKALSKAFHYAFRLLAVFIAGLIIWYFSLGGAFVVEQQERALVSTFGAVSPDVRAPGWHWAWPDPICQVTLVPASRRSLSTDAFWFYEKPGTRADDPGRYSGTHLVPGQDGYLITGDANIIHSAWKMFYRISDPYRYHIACYASEGTGTEPDDLLRDVFETSIMKVCAFNTADFALKSPLFRKAVQNEVSKRVVDLDIGITVEEVVLRGRTPPLGAVSAFQAVTQAELQSSTEKHQAKTYAVKTLNEAESECASVIADASAYKTRVVESVKSDARKFEDILAKYRKNPEVVPVALYSNALSEVLNSAEDMFILRAPDGDQEVRLLLNREPKRNDSERKEENNR
jgi:regulator of protease activity HflC (stomatin/prohibitin superfamily)